MVFLSHSELFSNRPWDTCTCTLYNVNVIHLFFMKCKRKEINSLNYNAEKLSFFFQIQLNGFICTRKSLSVCVCVLCDVQNSTTQTKLQCIFPMYSMIYLFITSFFAAQKSACHLYYILFPFMIIIR